MGAPNPLSGFVDMGAPNPLREIGAAKGLGVVMGDGWCPKAAGGLGFPNAKPPPSGVPLLPSLPSESESETVGEKLKPMRYGLRSVTPQVTRQWCQAVTVVTAAGKRPDPTGSQLKRGA